MNHAAIIAEYNPFHSGHHHQIMETRKLLGEESSIVVVMSGNWTQQGRCAILDKWKRSTLALERGADLIIELPTLWATASAQSFARGAVFLLERTGIVTHLSFGSEGGDLWALQQLSQGLDHPNYPTFLKQALKTGISFPSARQQALSQVLSFHKSETSDNTNVHTLLKSPNNTLGVEYLSALTHYQSSIKPLTIQRQGGGFHSIVPQGQCPPLHTSATDIREKINQQRWEDMPSFLSKQAIDILKSQDSTTKTPSLYHCETAILSKIYTMTADDWGQLPDSGIHEGLPQRLATISRQVTCLDEFLATAKTKRYTHARLQRLLLYSFLSIRQEHIPKHPPYLRVLGFTPRGQELLQQMKKTATLPILVKTANVKNLSPLCQQIFAQEVDFTNLYHLCFPKNGPTGVEWRTPPQRVFPQ